LARLLFAVEPAAVQQQAWVCLFRWYKRLDPRGDGPFRFEAESLRRFYGSVAEFVPVLVRFLGAGNPPAALQDLFVRDSLTKLLRYADANLGPEFAKATRAALELAEALRGVMASEECEFSLRLACVELLVIMAANGDSLREPVNAILRGFLGTRLDLAVSTALGRTGE
jgi:hypothetical protein